MATRTAAFDAVRGVLDKIRDYVAEHDTVDDIAELNRKYMPAALQDEITWVSQMAERLLVADPHQPDHDDAIDAPALPSSTT